ncbi:ClpP family protease [Streptomyces coriariae]|uniref:ClpP family protease n=1 Tax=Streptomyces coriariae TaxID=2864460 RepID=UPI001E4BFDD0|nr:ATP-dependent Clp protease proteolytic subunit [Streptomyces coriariae]
MNRPSARHVLPEFTERTSFGHRTMDPYSKLLAAGTPGKRYALPGARMTIRQPSLPEPVQGQASDLAIQAEELARTRASLEEMLVRHTGRTPEQVTADIERDRFLTAQEAVEYGLVDGIIPSRKASAGAPGGR